MSLVHANIVYRVIIRNVCGKIQIKYNHILLDIRQCLTYIGYTRRFGSCL
jgi:hypothetical protein